MSKELESLFNLTEEICNYLKRVDERLNRLETRNEIEDAKRPKA